MPRIKGEKRNLSIKIRLTAEEKSKLNELKTQTELASWIRDLALNQNPIKRADPELVRAIGRLGSNLNQIAKHANTNNELDNKVLLAITNIERELIELINSHKSKEK